MSKIFFIMGKSSSGKDTIFKKLIENKNLDLKTIVPYTTRPIREGEEQGKEYFFVDPAKMNELDAAGKIIEKRTYHTTHGDWHYFTAADGQIKLTGEDYYVVIGTLESYMEVREYLGHEYVIPIYIEVEDGLRLERALKREKNQKIQRYEELCRRFLADQQDFSEEKIKNAGIPKRYLNTELSQCLKEITQDILLYKQISV